MSGSTDVTLALQVRMGNLEAGLRKATQGMRQVQQQARQTQTAVATIGQSLSAFGSGMSGAFGSISRVLGPALAIFTTGGLVAGISAAVSRVNALADAASQVGVSVETLQTLQIAFEEAGSSAQVAEQGIGRLQTLLGDAARNNREAQETFVRLGVAYRNIDGSSRTASQAIDDLRAKIVGAASEQEKLSIAAEVFGQRGARAAVAALQELGGSVDDAAAGYARLGILISSDTANRLDTLGTAFANLGRAIVTAMANAVSAVTPQLVEWLNWLREQVVNAASSIAQVYQGIGRMRAQAADPEYTAARGTTRQAADAQDAITRSLERALEQRRQLQAQFDGTQNARVRRRLQSELETINQTIAAQEAGYQRSALAFNAAQAEYGRIQDRWRQRWAAEDAANVPGVAAAPTVAGAPPVVTAPRGGGAQRISEEVREANRLADALIRQGEAAARANDPLSALREQMEQLAAVRRLIGEDRFEAAMEGANAAMERMIQSSVNATGKVEGFWDAFARGSGASGKGEDKGFASEIGEGLGQLTNQAFSDLFNLFDKIADGSMKAGEAISKFALSFVQAVLKMVAQAAAMRIIQSFLGSMGGGTNMELGGIGMPKMAGGAVAGGYTYLVGERGPELFTAPGGGRIVPNHELGGGVSVTIQNNAPGVVVREDRISPTEIQMIVELSAAQAAANFSESMRTGHGSYAEQMTGRYNVRRRL